MKSVLLMTTFLAVPLAMAAGAVHAHGEKKHMPAAAVLAEQTVWGIAGKPQQVSRTIAIDMTDAMRFTPDNLTIREGETGVSSSETADGCCTKW